jgi:hypothetical protein
MTINNKYIFIHNCWTIKGHIKILDGFTPKMKANTRFIQQCTMIFSHCHWIMFVVKSFHFVIFQIKFKVAFTFERRKLETCIFIILFENILLIFENKSIEACIG